MIFNSIETKLISELKRSIYLSVESYIDSSKHSGIPNASVDFFNEIEKYFKPIIDTLPINEYSIDWVESIVKSYENSRIIQFYEAKEKFEKSLFEDLSNSSNLSTTIQRFVADAKAHQQQMGELAVVGAIAGSSAFVIGTIYQIIYDIINAFITIIKYAVYGVGYAISSAYSTIVDNDDEGPEIDSSVLKQFISEFNVMDFLLEDFPELIDGLLDFCYEIIDDFIKNAEKYGRMTGEYIRNISSGAVSGTMSLFFDAYDATASLSSRVWWAITQWFNLGTLIGPIIVDIVLLFCSGGISGVVSAAAKLGKIDKIADVLKFTKTTVSTAIDGLSFYTDIAKKIPTKVKRIIYKLFQKLWDATGAFADKFKDIVKRAYDAAGNSNLPSFEKIAEKIDQLYDSAESVNFIIAICLMFFGGNINEEGEFTI